MIFDKPWLRAGIVGEVLPIKGEVRVLGTVALSMLPTRNEPVEWGILERPSKPLRHAHALFA
jgi:hypothetical protein